MRKFLMVPSGKVDDYLNYAKERHIGEIVEGIPLALINLYKEEDLPIVYEENEEVHVAEPSESEILGKQLVEKDLQILELQQENQVLGQQLVDIDLRLLMGGI